MEASGESGAKTMATRKKDLKLAETFKKRALSNKWGGGVKMKKIQGQLNISKDLKISKSIAWRISNHSVVVYQSSNKSAMDIDPSQRVKNIS